MGYGLGRSPFFLNIGNYIGIIDTYPLSPFLLCTRHVLNRGKRISTLTCLYNRRSSFNFLISQILNENLTQALFCPRLLV